MKQASLCSVLLASCFAFALGGCAEAFSPMPGEHLTLRTQGAASQLRLDKDRLYGPSTEVARVGGNAFRGRWKGHVVDVRSTGEAITGVIGNGRTELYVKSGESILAVQGMFGGMLSNFRLSNAAFEGTVGQCAYDLKRNVENTAYEGRRACGGALQMATLLLPPTFATLPADERALYLLMIAAG